MGDSSRMKKMFLVIKLFILVIAIVLIFNCLNAPVCASTTFYSSEYLGYSYGLDEIELYNQTNTYNYLDLNQDNSYYNTSARNNEIVESEKPTITVITHGLGGSASHWSNQGTDDFAFSNDSLINMLDLLSYEKTCVDSNVYWGYYDVNSNLYLYDLKNSKNIDSNGKYMKIESIEKLADISKHIIVIFEASNGNKSNNGIYEEFNFMLSKIIYDVKVLNGGYLPKINLIGHSRGGITNLQYALDHPDLVDSIFSMGTPYFGSDTASTDLGAQIGGNVVDIIDRTVFQGYFDRWINNYDKLYSNIHGFALGGYSDLNFVFDRLIEDISAVQQCAPWITSELLSTAKYIINTSQISIPLLSSIPCTGKIIIPIIALISMGYSIVEINEIVSKLFFRYNDFQENEIESITQIINDISYYDPNGDFVDNIISITPVLGSPFFMNDLLVDLPSQLGIDNHSSCLRTYGFKTYAKCFNESNCNTAKSSVPSMPTIVHNLEAQDNDLIGFILANINIGVGNSTKSFNLSFNDAETINIDKYLGRKDLSSTIIPEYINGIKVTTLGEESFKDYLNEKNTVVVFPDSIIEIKDNAFQNCNAIESIKFSEKSNIQVINCYAFDGCSALTNVEYGDSMNTFPDSLEVLGVCALRSCALNRITFGKSLNYFGEGALAFNKLTEIIVTDENPKYYSTNGVLIDSYEKSICAVASLNEMEYYHLDCNISKIYSYAFAGHKTLKKVFLSDNLSYIGDYSFSNINSQSECLEIYTSIEGSIPFVGENSFSIANCSIYTSSVKKNQYINNEFKDYESIISSFEITLNYYITNRNGTEIIIPVKIKNGSFNNLLTINPDNYNYKGYRLNGWVINGIEQTRLENVYISSKDYSTVDARAVFELNDYIISFDATTDYDIIQYGSKNYEFHVPVKKGAFFCGWEDTNHKLYTNNEGRGICEWDKAENTKLYATWEYINYEIKYNLDGGNCSNLKYTYTVDDNDFILPIPSKTNYRFIKWQYENGESVTAISTSQAEPLKLTAIWESLKQDYWTGDSIKTNNTIINIKGGTSTNYVFYINSNVTNVTFIGNRTYSNFQIIIYNRPSGTNLNVTFDNMIIKAPTGKSAIKYEGTTYFQLWLTYCNSCKITGGKGDNSSQEGGTGSTGYAGINLENAYIGFQRQSSGSLSITGGQGGTGGTGKTGLVGAQGTDVTGLFLGNGGNGGQGGTGGTGGRGGTGGFAIIAKKLYFNPSCDGSLSITGGQGGTGGTGGRGGNGGRGGHGVGSRLISRNGGNGGQGGTGGTGGQGGNGGNALSITQSTYNIKYATISQGQEGNSGNGGQGGTGGPGGANGPSWFDAGKHGSSGNGGLGGSGGLGLKTGLEGSRGSASSFYYYCEI